MSTTKEREPLAVWAFEAAMNGLPEEEARRLVEGDRYPEPDDSELDGYGESMWGSDGTYVLYDPDRDMAWIQSDTSESLYGRR